MKSEWLDGFKAFRMLQKSQEVCESDLLEFA